MSTVCIPYDCFNGSGTICNLLQLSVAVFSKIRLPKPLTQTLSDVTLEMWWKCVGRFILSPLNSKRVYSCSTGEDIIVNIRSSPTCNLRFPFPVILIPVKISITFSMLISWINEGIECRLIWGVYCVDRNCTVLMNRRNFTGLLAVFSYLCS